MESVAALARLIGAAIPKDFDEARLRAELDTNWAQIDLRYFNARGAEQIDPLEGVWSLDLHDALDAVCDEMAAESGSRWTRCVFTLEPKGQFKINVEY